MNLYNKSRMDTYFGDRAAAFNDSCVVKFDQDGKDILVEYDIDGGIVQYIGRNLGGDHYELRAIGLVSGYAVLHQSAGSNFLRVGGKRMEMRECGGSRSASEMLARKKAGFYKRGFLAVLDDCAIPIRRPPFRPSPEIPFHRYSSLRLRSFFRSLRLPLRRVRDH